MMKRPDSLYAPRISITRLRLLAEGRVPAPCAWATDRAGSAGLAVCRTASPGLWPRRRRPWHHLAGRFVAAAPTIVIPETSLRRRTGPGATAPVSILSLRCLVTLCSFSAVVSSIRSYIYDISSC